MDRTKMGNKSNVKQLHPGLTPEATSHRILAAIRAVYALNVDLEKTDGRLRAVETDNLTDATQAYRTAIREADERESGTALSHEEAWQVLLVVCAGLRDHDAIRDANKAVRAVRKAERARVGQALDELHKPAKVEDSAQTLLPITGDKTGLGWFTAECNAVVYTALLEADKRGRIDASQAELLADLATSGLEAVAFVLDAADAVIDDVGDPAASDDIARELDKLVTTSADEASLPI
jgi:chromatin segregation and condensation protein Rec8/ScpA/Scc1 (kleisin family)